MNDNRKGFLLRRALFFVLVTAAMTVFTAVPAPAEDGAASQDGVLFSFGSGGKLRIVERSNIRVKENGTYAGLTYNESRGVLDYMWYEDGFSRYGGNYYVYEASKKDTRLIANPVDLREFCEIGISSQGRYSLPPGQILPVLRDFPVFPTGAVSPGDSWRDFGVRMVDPDNSGKYTKVRFYCEYRYEGLREVSTGLKHIINAQYALRYKPGDSSINDPDLERISGRHVVTIMIDDGDRSSIFIRDKLDEEYLYSSGRSLEHSGFILTWYSDIVGIDQSRAAEIAKETIDAEGIAGLDVIEKDEGLALSLRNLHFVPDSAELLPGDTNRLESIYRILNKTGVKKVLVVGHTADIGSAESQYELSEKRALAVIEKLTGLGMNPSMFIYEGRGGDEPAGDNSTEEGRAENRRVEIILLDD